MPRVPRELPVLFVGIATFLVPAALVPFLPEPWPLVFGAVGLAVTVWMAWEGGRPVELARRRRERGQCVPCGYDLSWNATGICPECGAAVEESRGASWGFPVIIPSPGNPDTPDRQS